MEELEHMTKDEFFAFMPLLIYGIAVSELIMHWRDYLKSERRYWPHLVTGLLLLELAFLNFYYLYDVLDLLFVDYVHFLGRLATPLVFLLMVSVYTPESDKNVKEYFLDKIPLVFSLLAGFIFLNMISEFNYDLILTVRIIVIILCLAIAITRRIWLIWSLIILRLILFVWFNFFQEYTGYVVQ